VHLDCRKILKKAREIQNEKKMLHSFVPQIHWFLKDQAPNQISKS
jgi:hypothetical protein